MTEDELLSNVLKLAKFAKWRACHFRPARTKDGWRTAVQGDKGFPDLVLVKDRLSLFIELKSDKGVLSDDQCEWLRMMQIAGLNAEVWRPADWKSGRIGMALGCPKGVIPR